MTLSSNIAPPSNNLPLVCVPLDVIVSQSQTFDLKLRLFEFELGLDNHWYRDIRLIGSSIVPTLEQCQHEWTIYQFLCRLSSLGELQGHQMVTPTNNSVYSALNIFYHILERKNLHFQLLQGVPKKIAQRIMLHS